MTGLQFRTMKARITRIERALFLILSAVAEPDLATGEEPKNDYEKEMRKLYQELKDVTRD